MVDHPWYSVNKRRLLKSYLDFILELSQTRFLHIFIILSKIDATNLIKVPWYFCSDSLEINVAQWPFGNLVNFYNPLVEANVFQLPFSFSLICPNSRTSYVLVLFIISYVLVLFIISLLNLPQISHMSFIKQMCNISAILNIQLGLRVTKTTRNRLTLERECAVL